MTTSQSAREVGFWQSVRRLGRTGPDGLLAALARKCVSKKASLKVVSNISGYETFTSSSLKSVPLKSFLTRLFKSRVLFSLYW